MIEIVQRTSRNIMNSVQTARRDDHLPSTSSNPNTTPELEAAWYSMLWAFMILGESNGGSSFLRRRHWLRCSPSAYTSRRPPGQAQRTSGRVSVGSSSHRALPAWLGSAIPLGRRLSFTFQHSDFSMLPTSMPHSSSNSPSRDFPWRRGCKYALLCGERY